MWVPGVDHVLDLAAAASVTCAVLGDRRVSCWGDAAQLFPAESAAIASGAVTPTRVEGVVDAVAVRTGGAHACALRLDATVICWGLDDRGQLGNGELSLGDFALAPGAAPP